MAHSNTILAQLLNFVDRHDFQKLENGQYRPQRKYRTLSRWSQFATMMFAQITGRTSLRDITDTLQTQAGRLYHLGMGSVKKSTLADADANNRRPAEFFQAFFEKSYQRCAAFASITDAKTSDLAYARTLILPPGSIVAADRAYIDFSWLLAV
jgi:hypothetical protein